MGVLLLAIYFTIFIAASNAQNTEEVGSQYKLTFFSIGLQKLK